MIDLVQVYIILSLGISGKSSGETDQPSLDLGKTKPPCDFQGVLQLKPLTASPCYLFGVPEPLASRSHRSKPVGATASPPGCGEGGRWEGNRRLRAALDSCPPSVLPSASTNPYLCFSITCVLHGAYGFAQPFMPQRTKTCKVSHIVFLWKIYETADYYFSPGASEVPS